MANTGNDRLSSAVKILFAAISG